MSSQGTAEQGEKNDNKKSLLEEAQSEMATLSRVSHRLAMTEAGENLDRVLKLLLPKLLMRIGKNHHRTVELSKTSSSNSSNLKNVYDQIHAKLVEMLGHSMNRVRADQNCTLPCLAIVELLDITNEEDKTDGNNCTTNIAQYKNNVDAFTLNLGLAFLTLGLPRCPMDEILNLLPRLLSLLGTHSVLYQTATEGSTVARRSQLNQVSHLVLRTIQRLVNENQPAAGSGTRESSSSSPSKGKESLAKQQSNSSSNSDAPSSTANNVDNKEEKMSPLDRARYLCLVAACSGAMGKNVGAALYELLLDSLLYQPIGKAVVSNREELMRLGDGPPPAGLSSEGHRRLITGPASSSYLGTVKNWYNEHLPPVKLRDFKAAILTFLAPSGRWAIFYPPTATTTSNPISSIDTGMGVARTLALLVVASGDVHGDVAQKGTSYLKMYLDTAKRSSRAPSSTTNNGGGVVLDDTTPVPALTPYSIVRAPIPLACELLGLILGGYGTNSIMKKYNTNSSIKNIPCLQENPALLTTTATATSKVSYRSPIKEAGAVTIMKFVQSKIFDDEPHLLQQDISIMNMDIMEEREGVSSSREGATDHSSYAFILGQMTISVADLMLIQGAKSSGTSNSSHGRSGGNSPKVAAAKMLNSLCVRFLAHYEKLCSYQESEMVATKEQEQTMCNDDVNHEQRQQQETSSVRYILSRIFSTACKVLSTASTPHDSGSTYPAEARDSCYGIVCVLARSKSIVSPKELITTATKTSLPNERQSFLFDGSIVPLRHSSSSSEEEVGDQSAVLPGATAMSNVTATLLFGCVANEEESLRIRATAALDALMTAYGRWIKNVQAEQDVVAPAESTTQMEVDHDDNNNILLTTETNPWATSPHSGFEEAKDSSLSSLVLSGGSTITEATSWLKEQVCRSLMPLLWRAAHTSQTKASRLAAASWSNEVIRPLDVVNATHLLCFLSGDKDDTTSTLARKALRVNDLDEDTLVNKVQEVDVDSNEQQHDNHNTKNENTALITDDYPEMNDIVKLLLQDGGAVGGGSTTSRPTFYDFSFRAKGTTLRLCLACLLSDFYGGDDDAVNSFMKAIIRTIQTLVTEWMGFNISKTGSQADLVELSNQPSSSSSSSKKNSDALELLEDCSVALAGCLTCSTYARQWLARCSSSSLEGTTKESGTQGTTTVFNQHSLALLAVIAPSSKARRLFAKCCGVLYDDIDLWTATTTTSLSPTESSKITTSTISTWIDQSGISQALQLASETLSVLHHPGETQPTTNFKLDKVHGAAHLGSYCVRSLRWNMFRHDETLKADEISFKACGDTSSTIIECLGKGCLQREEMIGNACSDGLNVAFSHIIANMVGDDVPLLSSPIRTSCKHALMELSKAATVFGNGERSDSIRVIAVARAIGPTLAATTNVGATTSTEGDKTNKTDLESSWQTVRLNCIDSLFNLLGSTSNRNESEVALVVGEALAKFADAYSPPGIEWTTPSMDKPDVYDPTYAASLPPHEMVIYRLLECELQSSSPQKRTAVAPALLAIVAHAAELTNKGGIYKSRALVTTIVKQLVQIQSSFLLLLKDPKSKQLSRESACLGLAACYGIATQTTNHHDNLQQKSDNDEERSPLSSGATNLHTRLLQAFGQTTNFGGSAMMETREQNAARVAQNRASSNDGGTSAMLETMGLEETNGGRVTVEEGGAAGLGEAALGAYREMASAALALNRPDVLYSLMLLSVTDILWTTPGYRDRYNASTLLGSGGRGSSSLGSHHNIYEIRLALRPHLSNLVPRLLRACHDPSKQTREQIGALWQALTGGGAEARALITEHFLVTFDTLIKDASSKLWRARTGACGALADIIVGRSWEELGGGLTAKSLEDIQFVEQDGECVSAGVRLLMLWRVTTRALDDVRSNVRESGETLARSVSSLTVRLCNPDGEVSPGENSNRSQRGALSSSKAATGTILPWLVEYGLNQPSAEATGACISCLLGIIETAKPTTLAPVLPSLIGSLTLAISGLEPAALNYLQVRAAGRSSSNSNGDNNQEERIERVRLQLAQSGPINTALTKCIDMVRHVSLDIQRQVIPQIDNALRCGAGFATRAAAADSVTTLVSTCPEAFQFQGSTLSNPTVRLLRALYYASQRERGTMARDRMTHALGSVASIAPGSAVRGLVMKMCLKYKQATGSRDDVSARLTVAYGLRSIAVRATQQCHEGGPRDIWRRQVLPIAFLGLREDNTKIVSLWSDVWEEGGSAVSSNHRNHSSSFADDDDENDVGGHGGYTLEEKLLPYLVDTCVTALDDVSWSRRRAACIALEELAKKYILAPSPRSSGGDMSVDEIKRAERRAKASCRAISACVNLLRNKRRIWDGKRHLALAIETMVRQWMISPFIVANNNNASCPILGWSSSENLLCPWSPFLFGGSSNDLFEGDGWFLATTKEQDTKEDTVMMEAETEDIETDENPPGVTESTEGEETNNDDKDSPLGVDDTMIEEEEEAMEKEEQKEDTSVVVARIKNENNKQDQEQATTTQIVTFVGLLRLLLEQAFVSEAGLGSSTEVLPFKAASLQALSNISSAYRDIVNVNSTSSSSSTIEQRQQQEEEGNNIQHTMNDLKLAFDTLAPKLYEMLAEDDKKKNHKDKAPPPALIVARMFDCYSSILYPNFDQDTTTSTTDGNPYAQITNLSNMVLDNTNIVKQAAWTVRESSARFAATLATHLSVSILRKLSTIQMFMKCTTQTISDRKFWKVRKAGLQILVALTYRCRSSQTSTGGGSGGGGQKRQYSALTQMSSSSSSHQLVVTGNDATMSSPSGTNGHNESRLILEALLPQKERILQILRTSLQDTESQVTSVATEVFNAMATWP